MSAPLACTRWAWADALRHARKLAGRHQIRYRVIKVGGFWYITESDSR